jgi:hypothetical protein
MNQQEDDGWFDDSDENGYPSRFLLKEASACMNQQEENGYPGAEEEELIYDCEKTCGYQGVFEDVCLHEATCGVELTHQRRRSSSTNAWREDTNGLWWKGGTDGPYDVDYKKIPVEIDAILPLVVTSYACEKHCGYVGSFEEICVHETSCRHTEHQHLDSVAGNQHLDFWEAVNIDDLVADEETDMETWACEEKDPYRIFPLEGHADELPSEIMVPVEPSKIGMVMFDWTGWSDIYPWKTSRK